MSGRDDQARELGFDALAALENANRCARLLRDTPDHLDPKKLREEARREYARVALLAAKSESLISGRPETP